MVARNVIRVVPIQAARLKITEAAKFLSISRKWMLQMAGREIFSVQRDHPRGDLYLLLDELQLYTESNANCKDGTKGVEAVLRFRKEKGRISQREFNRHQLDRPDHTV